MMFLRRSSIASQPASNEQFSIMGLPWVTSSDLSSRVMGFRVHIEMSNENGRVKLNFQPCVRSGVGFDPWRGFLGVERKSFNPPGQESDVSIYGERQTLLRFCFRGSHLSSFFLPRTISGISSSRAQARLGDFMWWWWWCVCSVQINTQRARIVTKPLHHSGAKNLQDTKQKNLH